MPSDFRNTSPTSRARADGRAEHVTSTGMRIVGREAIDLVTQAAEAATVPPGRDENLLFTSRFTVRPRMGAGSAVPAILTALHRAIALEWVDAPPLLQDRALTRRPGRFTGLHWDVIGEVGAWTGELLWRHPHPVVSGAPCTTHAIITEHGLHVTLTLRVTSDGGIAAVRGMVGAGQARPSFLSELSRSTRMIFDGSDGTPRPLAEMEVEDFVTDVLLSETREHAVAVLSPYEKGGYVISPEEAALELFGLAELYFFERHPATFRLSDALGDKRLSCYWGALRVYMPGFSCADRPDEHPLLVHDRLIDPVMRAEVTGKLGRAALQRVRMPPGVEALRHPPVPETVEPAAPAEPVAAPAAPQEVVPASGNGSATPAAPQVAVVPTVVVPEELRVLPELLAQLSGTMTKLVEANVALSNEILRLNTATAVRAVNTNALEKRMSSLVALLQRYVNSSGALADGGAGLEGEAQEETEEDAERLTLLDVLREAAESHSDALLILDAAERSAARSPFEDVDRVAVIFDAMAQVARRRQEGALGVSLRDAFRELGVDYRGGRSDSTSKRHMQQYLITGPRGQQFDCAEHIAVGDSYDPRHCLRVYFTSRAPVEPRFVIGHVGRHFNVETTT